MPQDNPFRNDPPFRFGLDPNPALQPPGVQRLGGRGVGTGLELTAGGGNGGQGVLDVREIWRYPLVVTGSLAVPAVSTLIVAQPAVVRVLFTIRAPAANTGTVYVSFGIAASALTGMFELVPGVQVYLDTVVPQDDVYVIAIGGAADAVFCYGEAT
jgi:hypothetical protein